MNIENQIYALEPNEYLKGYDLLKRINDIDLKCKLRVYIDHMRLLANSFFG